MLTEKKLRLYKKCVYSPREERKTREKTKIPKIKIPMDKYMEKAPIALNKVKKKMFPK